MNKREIGSRTEETAREYIKGKGLQILESNFRCRIGEIDIIARDKEYLVFIEVKYRKSSVNGLPSEAVNFRKIKKICKVSDFYRLINHINDDTPIRFDVISITRNETEWFKNAFEYIN